MRLTRTTLRAAGLACLLTIPLSAQAQQYSAGGRYFPLHQNTPPGTAARWAVQSGKVTPGYFQPVRFEIAGGARVTVFDRTPERAIPLEAPAQAAFLVGQIYRFKISDMPDFPNAELYPSLEMIDRLHPPPGRIDDFPILVQITPEEIEWALEGRLVTKVIYLEQPQLVEGRILDDDVRVLALPPNRNAIAEADLRGRPMAILRIGGRVPTSQPWDAAFFGPGAPVLVGRLAPPAVAPDPAVPAE